MGLKHIAAITALLLCFAGCTAGEIESVAKSQQEADTEAEAQIIYSGLNTWDDSIGTRWYTAVVEVENNGNSSIMLSSATMDVEDESGALAGIIDLGRSIPEIIEPGEIGYYIATNILDYTVPDGHRLNPHIKAEAHNEPTRYPISDVSIKDTDYNGVKATCRVENNTDESISSPRVSIILLGEDNHAVARIMTYAGEFAPGEKIGVECSALTMAPGITADSISGYVAVAEPMFQW